MDIWAILVLIILAKFVCIRLKISSKISPSLISTHLSAACILRLAHSGRFCHSEIWIERQSVRMIKILALRSINAYFFSSNYFVLTRHRNMLIVSNAATTINHSHY